MDLECMSDSSCDYEDFGCSDSLVVADTSSIFNNFENISSKFCQDATFEMPITNQISYPNVPTLIKVASGNSFKYLLLQPSAVQSPNSENTNPKVAVVDVTEKVVEVPAGNPPIPAANNIPAPVVQQNAQLVPKKAPNHLLLANAAKSKNQPSILKEIKTPVVLLENLKPSAPQNTGFLPNPKQIAQNSLVKPLQEQFSNHSTYNQVVVLSKNPPIPAPVVQQNAQLVPKIAPKIPAKGKKQLAVLKEVKTPVVLLENLKPSACQNTSFLPNPKQIAQNLLVKPLHEHFSNHNTYDQEVVQARQQPAGISFDLNFLPSVQQNIEIASTEQPTKSDDCSPPLQDSMGVDLDLLFQAWDDNSQQAGITPTVVHENVEAVYDETFEDFTNSPLYTVNQQSTTKSKSRKKNVIKKQPKGIATLVFFDLETTGLPHTVGTSNVQVTEVSMIAVDRNEFCKSQSPEIKDWRIVHKLSMVVKPRSYIDPVAARITGLDDVMLKDQEIFDENTAKAVVSFLSHLTKPACLLAHNGKRFDFPLLKAELNRHAMDFPQELYLSDTLLGLRAVDVGKLPSTPKTPKAVKRNKDGKLSMTLENLHVFFFNRKHQGGHSSEGDCVALAKICHKVKDIIIPWMDENCESGSTVLPMW